MKLWPGLVLLAATLLAGCSANVSVGDVNKQYGDPAEAKYGDITLHQDDGNEKAGNATESFLSHQKVIHMECAVDRDLKDVETTWKLTGVKTTEGDYIEILTLSDKVTGKGFSAMFKVPHVWPVGDYRVDLSVAGKPVASRDFMISSDGKAHHEIGVTGLTLYRDLNGEAGKKVEAFLPTDRKMHFEATTLGSRKQPVKVKWAFLKRDETGDTFIHDVTTEIVINANSVLTANISLPRNWPMGDYVAVVTLDGELAAEFEYKVVADGTAVK